MDRKKLAVALVVGMLVLGMLGTVAGASGVSGKLTIWSWGAGGEKEAREAAVNAFIKAYPQLDVEHSVIPTADSVWDQKQAAAYSAGTAADVMQMSPDYYGLLSRYYEDLRSYVERDGINLEELTTPGILDGYYRPDGKLEAMPLLANCFVFAYNKELFDRFGVAYPTDDWTWEDFAEMAPKFVSGS
ncbi:MAG: carbohydrate ABC transporter substrate-binding protein, partial [Firmicutes bacterium]|nr:carbohydrate ABC transporter substrate-binding protein [Bacillota bacterium]